ncbi:hypothetical protein QFC24_005129 [Naganishia onofrii]|uniref:Uncharacterized protein n=1 Tax=Naganishia onofrii TaxID=1851511 RepID=A0ACC2X976_9TREE|nr:hypothetical protein QFC24_005129 [Naganishia onofrii]
MSSQFSHQQGNNHRTRSRVTSVIPPMCANHFDRNSGSYLTPSGITGSYTAPTNPSHGFTGTGNSFSHPGYNPTISYPSPTSSAFSARGSDHNVKDLVDHTRQLQLRSPYPATEEEDSDSEDSAARWRNDRRGAQGTPARRRSWMKEAKDRLAETEVYVGLIESVFDLEDKKDGLKAQIRRQQEKLSDVQTDLGLVQDELQKKYSGWLSKDGYSQLDQNGEASFEVPLLLDQEEDPSDEEKGIQVIQRGSHIIKMTHTPGQPLQIAITSNDRHVPQNDHSSVPDGVTGRSSPEKHGGRVSKIPVPVWRLPRGTRVD